VNIQVSAPRSSSAPHSLDLSNRDLTRPYNVGKEASAGRVRPDRPSMVVLAARRSRLGRSCQRVWEQERGIREREREFETVLPGSGNGRLIVSDDVQKNLVFSGVTRRHGLRSYTPRAGGIARKSG
jgi:hypothetical protein